MMGIHDLKTEHLKYHMSEQKRARNTCGIIMSIFYQPLDHKGEMQGAFLATTLLAQRKLEQ